MTILYRTVLVFTIVLLVLNPLGAEVLYLKNGNLLIGKIIAQSRSDVVILTDSGRRITQEKTGIRKIAYSLSDEDEEKIKNQQMIEEIKQKREQLEKRLKEQGDERKEIEDELAELADQEAEFFEGELAYLIKQKHKEIIMESAMVPGLGQYSKDEYWKTGLAGGLFLGGLGAAYYANSQFETAKADYEQQNLNYLLFAYSAHSLPLSLYYYSQISQQRSTMTTSSSTLAIAGGIVMAVYLLSLSDAWVFKPDPDPEWQGEGEAEIGIHQEEVIDFSRSRWDMYRNERQLISFGWSTGF